MEHDILKRIDRKAFSMVGHAADELSYECYAVGGYVRDLFLNRHSKDIDFVSVGQGSGIDIARRVVADMGRGAKVHVYRTYGTAQVKMGRTELEFVGARRESYRSDSRNPIVEEGTLADDISRRDFTINAMALCVNEGRFGELVDMFDGLSDLKNKIIRTPLDPDITFSDETFEAIRRNAARIDIITRERISTELGKIMASPRPSIGWYLLSDTGLLQHILPELQAMRGVEIVRGRGHKDNFEHTMLVLDRVAEKSDNVWLRWSALLHDIAKPVTKRWDDTVGWTFHNHNFIGSKMVPRIFKELKMPLGEPMRYVQKMVELHMRPIALVEETVTDSAVRRLITDAANDLDDLMTLCRADITSRNPEKVRQHLANFDEVLAKMADVTERDHLRNFQPPVDGALIMKTFGLEPSALVGEIKNAIKDAVLDGVIPNEYDQAYQLMLEIGRSHNLTPVSES